MAGITRTGPAIHTADIVQSTAVAPKISATTVQGALVEIGTFMATPTATNIPLTDIGGNIWIG